MPQTGQVKSEMNHEYMILQCFRSLVITLFLKLSLFMKDLKKQDMLQLNI